MGTNRTTFCLQPSLVFCVSTLIALASAAADNSSVSKVIGPDGRVTYQQCCEAGQPPASLPSINVIDAQRSSITNQTLGKPATKTAHSSTNNPKCEEWQKQKINAERSAFVIVNGDDGQRVVLTGKERTKYLAQVEKKLEKQCLQQP